MKYNSSVLRQNQGSFFGFNRFVELRKMKLHGNVQTRVLHPTPHRKPKFPMIAIGAVCRYSSLDLVSCVGFQICSRERSSPHQPNKDNSLRNPQLFRSTPTHVCSILAPEHSNRTTQKQRVRGPCNPRENADSKNSQRSPKRAFRFRIADDPNVSQSRASQKKLQTQKRVLRTGPNPYLRSHKRRKVSN
jgi:hypothetical protein